jgi:hypothetical protein
MNENGTNGKEKKELISIAVPAFPDFDGERVSASKGYGPRGAATHKFEFSIPVPRTNEEATEYYGCTLNDLLMAGCRQKTYSTTNVDNYIAEQFEAGNDPDAVDLEKFAAELADDLKSIKRERTGVLKEAKKVAAGLKDLGMSADEAIAELKKLKGLA